MIQYKINWKQLLIITLGGIFFFTFVVQINKEKETQSKELKILFIGNSITKHPPKPSVGWLGNYGMAATGINNDYVHKFMSYIRKDKKINSYMAINVSQWERNFLYAKDNYLKAKNFEANLIIIRLGENIDEKYAKNMNFKQNLLELINFFKSNNRAKVIITNTFWPREFLSNKIFELSEEKKYIFVDISDLWNDKSNAAFGQFGNIFVQRHPSNKGMDEIAKKIYQQYREDIL